MIRAYLLGWCRLILVLGCLFFFAVCAYIVHARSPLLQRVVSSSSPRSGPSCPGVPRRATHTARGLQNGDSGGRQLCSHSHKENVYRRPVLLSGWLHALLLILQYSTVQYSTVPCVFS